MASGGLIPWSWRGALARAVLGALVISLWAASAGTAAAAAETVVSFEGLANGTEVEGQLQGQGIEFGLAKHFGQTSPGGDCGAPTVGEVAGFVPPKYAELEKCPPAVGELSGTYGALTKHPRGALSMRVRDVAPGAPSGPQVTLRIYDGQGNQLGEGKAKADPGGWAALSAAQTGGNNFQISYFSVATATTPDRVAIDDITYETPPEESPPGPPPPLALRPRPRRRHR